MIVLTHPKLTIASKLSPNTIYAWYNGLTSKSTLSADFLSQVGDLSSKLLQLIHHRVDRVLELSNLRILLHGMDEYLLAEITICNSRNDCADFLEHLLVCSVDLRVLLDLPLKLLDRYGAAVAVEDSLCGCLLVV